MHIFLRALAQILRNGSELFQVILLTQTWKTPHVMMEVKWMQAIYGMVHVIMRSIHVLHHWQPSSLASCNKHLTSLLTNLAYQPPHQPCLPAFTNLAYQPSPTSLTSLHQPHLPAFSPT